jgi:hypothetical protein
MKSPIFFFLLAATTAVIAQPHPDTLWTRVFGGTTYECAYDIRQTSDGGYIAAGYTNSFGAGGYDCWLVKVDSTGDRQWSRTYGGQSDERAYSVQQTSDGGYILAGYTCSFGAVGGDLYMVKTNELGDTLWTRMYVALEGDVARSVEQTADGGYILGGSTDSYGAGELDFYLFKTDHMGNMEWRQVYGGSNDDEAFAAYQTIDGGYIMGGNTTSFGAGYSDFYLVKTDNEGDTLWTHTYGGIGWDRMGTFQPTEDGGYIIVGDSRSFGLENYDFYLVKTNSSGEEEWARTIGEQSNLDDFPHYVKQTSDGGYIIAGICALFGPSGCAIWLVRTDERGDTLWSRTYGGPSYENAYVVRQTMDWGYIIAGATESFGAGAYDMYLIKTGPDELLMLPHIEVSADSLGFGSVRVGEQSELPLSLYNRGGSTLVLYNVYTSDSSFTTDFDPADSLVLPNDSLIIAVWFTPEETTSYSGTLTVENNDELVSIELFGVGEPPSIVTVTLADRIPKSCSLLPPHPNPFNSVTSIAFEVPSASWVNLATYNILGQKIATLANSYYQPGRYRILFNPDRLASGIYFVSLDYTEGHQMQKILYLK